MKNIWKIALMVAALMTSCSQPDLDELNPNEGANGKEIKFYTEANRTTYFKGEGLGINWEEGDEVPIIARSFFDGTEKRVRKYYTAASAGASTTFTSTAALTWDTALNSVPMNTIDVDFYAFHCGYKRSTSTTIYNGITVYSSPVQEQSVAGNYSHIGNYTVLASNKVSRPVGNTEPIGFQFTNCMSIVELTLKGDDTKKIKSVTLTSEKAPLQFEEAFLCVEDLSSSADVVEEPYAIILKDGKGTVDGKASSTVTVKLNDWTTLSAEGIKLYFVVLPGAHEAGDITLSTIDENGNMASVKMGAITFEKNKVYRPSIILSEFESAEKAATIKHIFSDGYSLPVPFENGARVIMERYNYPMANVPVALSGYDVATILPSKYPTTNKIVALTEGWAYILVGASGSATITNANKAKDWFATQGWEPASLIPEDKLPTAVADVPSDALYYPSGSENALMILFKRYMTAGEEFDLTGYSSVVKNFQGIRPVAKEIINESDKLTLYLNFTADGAQDWPTQASFNNVKKNVYQGTQTYVFPDGSEYDFEFSGTPNEGGSSLYNQDGSFLMMYLRTTQVESVGLPAIEGYKLANVAGVLYNKPATTIGISSVAAPEEPVYVSDVFTFDTSVNSWSLDVNNAEVNTRYYFYGTDKVDGSQDLRIKFMTLVYDKAE